jgi:phenylpyruvate tautomerase PptA (4-oxalocrotonate tautomerase family)
VGGYTDTTYVQPPGKFLVRVSIPEGYMNQMHKTEVHSAVTRAIVEIESPGTPSDGTNVLVIIEEVLEGNWGAAGNTLTLNKIADAVGLSRTGERFKWVRAYFDSKARSYAAAKYPADASGLLPP